MKQGFDSPRLHLSDYEARLLRFDGPAVDDADRMVRVEDRFGEPGGGGCVRAGQLFFGRLTFDDHPFGFVGGPVTRQVLSHGEEAAATRQRMTRGENLYRSETNR